MLGAGPVTVVVWQNTNQAVITAFFTVLICRTAAGNVERLFHMNRDVERRASDCPLLA